MLKSKKLLKILLTTVTALTLSLAMAMAAAAEVIPALDEYNVKYAGGDSWRAISGITPSVCRHRACRPRRLDRYRAECPQ